MFYHVKDLQYNARVSRPDPAFATLLLEQFGGANGELAAALRYFGQAFAARNPFPDKYDLLMDIATEEFSHLEIVGATIQMLLQGVNGDLKKAADESEIMQMLDGRKAKEEIIHRSMIAPQFLTSSGGGPAYTNSQGVPWSAAYINGDCNGDLTVDLRSDIAAESRAKITYEYLLQFTDDPYVKDTLNFLMTREVAHYQMFEAALETIQPNFPPGVLQSDPRYSNLYFNMSSGSDIRGPWNEGESSQLGETWQFIEDPVSYVLKTNGLTDIAPKGTARTLKGVDEIDHGMSAQRSEEINMAVPIGEQVWSQSAKDQELENGSTHRSKK
ncbi:manganese catalase family protein [Chitinophaga sancti]|uniref:Manganese catalase family protein n=1 Tax=Chitinophaga sancti TaxID=1004 RepID=A0A1K1RZ59_9BACT|nr:manganese catalase family protein [Chitinophaga sancti]WQD64114.1 manganese catalase family protein [Chitinophaga sancti]WQG90262.1 manganese catalase family protein [Chitinophaga sancti]SFW77109.1 Mn-containing catalase [Chitinophaga sancti]